MPVIITKNGVDYYLVPAPLVSFNRQTYNNIGRPGFGADYSASLQGTLVQTHGNPYYSSGVAAISTSGWTSTPDVESAEISSIDANDLLDATIKKQEKIRSLFTNSVVSGVAQPIKVTIKGWDTDHESDGLVFQAFVDDVSFESEGRWANPGSYTVNLRNTTFISSANSGEFSPYSNETQADYHVSSITENFDIQEDAQKTIKFDSNYQFETASKVYSVTRSITVVGSPVYDESGNYVSGLAPWQQASGYIYSHLGLGSGQIPNSRFEAIGLIGAGYNVGNINYQETIDQDAGSYSLTETYFAYTGVSPVIETLSVSKDINESETSSINVQGTIQGLNTSDGFSKTINSFNNAETYWDTLNSTNAYHYALSAMGTGVWLHPKPLSQSVARDFNNGTISYTYNFDDRPPNLVSGSVSESIQINDTYPGEIFSVTPVIGRSQPVLQYLNSRSEYKRSLSININMGAITPTWDVTVGGTDVNSQGLLINNQTGIMTDLINSKPSITNQSELNYIYQAANPINDPQILATSGKCFHSAPSENWDPRTRNYSYSIEWTYEK